MIASLPRCAHTARTNALRFSGQARHDAVLSGTPGLHFRTIADVIKLTCHDGQGTANAVGCNHPPGFKSPILRSSQNTQGQGLTHQAAQGCNLGCSCAHP